jgi:hypothetical protein
MVFAEAVLSSDLTSQSETRKGAILVVVVLGEVVAKDCESAALVETLHVFGFQFEWRPMG